jgi:3-oxo-5-alpha-steroid 4-dehydrogenase 1
MASFFVIKYGLPLMLSLHTLNIITCIWIAIGLIAFPLLLNVTQPYGRHISNKWGPMISNKLGWIIQESPSMIFLSVFFFTGTGTKSHAAWFFWALWVLHYINRSIIFPLRTHTNHKKIPLLIVGSAIFFNFINGFVNGTFLGNFAGGYPDDYFSSPQFVTGMLIFITGVYINNQSDTILINLRKPGETGYKIPTGGLFKYISCPNMFGEIIEWLGFAIMVGSLPAWSFALWTAVNLIPRALDHHKWYIQKFSDYPKGRKAVIPFVV